MWFVYGEKEKERKWKGKNKYINTQAHARTLSYGVDGKSDPFQTFQNWTHSFIAQIKMNRSHIMRTVTYKQPYLCDCTKPNLSSIRNYVCVCGFTRERVYICYRIGAFDRMYWWTNVNAIYKIEKEKKSGCVY